MTTLGDIQVRPLTAADATRELAIGVMSVHLDASADRFGQGFRKSLEETLRADLQNPAHIASTLEQLHKGPGQGWYWAAALGDAQGVTVVHGFAVCEVRTDDIFLMELHTHPNSQRRGVATAMLKELLQYVCNGPRGVAVTALPVTLNVARQNPKDDSEHPFAWYRSLTFRPIGKFYDFSLGGQMLPMDHMRASVGDILESLRIDRERAVD